MSTVPLDVDKLTALEKAANPAPWFFNGYSAIFSKTMNDGYDEWVEPLVDANHSLDRSACAPCDGKACQHATEEYHRDPAVAWVPAHHGDTAIGKRIADAQLIEAMRNALPTLLDELAKVRAELDEARRTLRAARMVCEADHFTQCAKDVLRLITPRLVAVANPATTSEPAAPKAAACNGNCIHHRGEVVIEDLCCPLHGADAEPAAS